MDGENPNVGPKPTPRPGSPQNPPTQPNRTCDWVALDQRNPIARAIGLRCSVFGQNGRVVSLGLKYGMLASHIWRAPRDTGGWFVAIIHNGTSHCPDAVVRLVSTRPIMVTCDPYILHIGHPDRFAPTVTAPPVYACVYVCMCVFMCVVCRIFILPRFFDVL